jgi:Predicted membrane protein
VLEPVIEVISEIRFRVTGTMSDPVVEELERKSKEIEIPESILPMVGGELPAPTEGAEPKTDAAPVKNSAPTKTDATPPVEPEKNNGQPAPDADKPKEEPAKAVEEEGLPQAPMLPKVEPLEPSQVEPEQPKPLSPKVALSINTIQGDSHAHQPVAMSEQSRRQRESVVYRIAA